jgi:hypothetical protein
MTRKGDPLRSMARVAVVALVLVLSTTSPTSAALRAFPLGQWGQLGIELPAGWTAVTQGPDASGGSAIRIQPGRDVPLVLLMTPIPGTGSPEDVDAAVGKLAEQIRQQIAAVAVETDLPVRELRSPYCHARYVSATDKTVEKPTATDFRYVDQGGAAVGRLLVTFTLLTNVKDAPERAQALEIVRSASHGRPTAPWLTPEGGVALAYPGKTWKLAMDLPGFDIEPTQLKAGGKGVRLAGYNKATKMIITAFLEEAHPGWTAIDHREDAWKTMQRASPMDRQDVKRSERGNMALLEMFVPSYKGKQTNQKHVNAYLVRDGVWIDVHLSKVDFKDADMALFEKVLGSVRLVD